mgnify:CR=1 FL=1
MKTAWLSMTLGLALISAALLAESAGLGETGNGRVQAQFRLHDLDGDGHISRPEARERNAGLHTHFSKFDRDADGVLSLEEFRRHAAPAYAER